MPTIYDFDGFEDYDTSGIGREHVRVETPANASIVSGGRKGGSRLKCVSGGAMPDVRLCRVLPVVVHTLCVGAYVELTSLAAPSIASHYFYDFRDSGSSQLGVGYFTDGTLFVRLAGTFFGSAANDWDFWGGGGAFSFGTNLGLSAAGTIQANVGFHLQVKVTIHATAGAVEVKVNGVTVIGPLTNICTQFATDEVTNLVYGLIGGGTVYFDDMWFSDDFLGDCIIWSHFPRTPDGDHLDGVPLGAGDHYVEVNEKPEPDDDTSYVTVTGAGERESYYVDALVETGATILAIETVIDAKKTDVGEATISDHIRQDSTDADGTVKGLSVAYGRIKQVYQTDPVRGGAWTESGFNAAQYGVKKVT